MTYLRQLQVLYCFYRRNKDQRCQYRHGHQPVINYRVIYYLENQYLFDNRKILIMKDSKSHKSLQQDRSLSPSQNRLEIEEQNREDRNDHPSDVRRIKKRAKIAQIINSILCVAIIVVIIVTLRVVVDSGNVNPQLAEKIKKELAKELDDKFQNELTPVLKKDIQQTIQKDLNNDFQQHLKENIQQGIKKDLKKELRQVLRDDIRQDIIQGVLQEIRKNFRKQLTVQINKQLEDRIIKELKIKESNKKTNNKQQNLDLSKDLQKNHFHRPFTSNQGHFTTQFFIEHSSQPAPFKKILWLFNPTQLEASNMQHGIIGENINHFGRMDGFQVRVVNNLNAYDWLSSQTINFIKQAHQRSTVEMPIYELLRLALLYQHGGVSIRIQNIILMNSIQWTQDLMNGNITQNDRQTLSCGQGKPEVIMLHRDTINTHFEVFDDVIIARPKAKIFVTLLNDIAKIIHDGVWPYPYYNITTFDKDTEVVAFPSIVEALLNIYQAQKKNLCKQFAIESFHQSKGSYLLSIDQGKTVEILGETQKNFEVKYGKFHMIWINSRKLVKQINTFIKKEDLSFGGESSLLKTKVIMTDGNKWLAAAPKIHRNVHFCIVSLKPQESKKTQKSALQKEDFLGKQSFKSWNLVHFVKGLSVVSRKMSERTSLVNASVYEGLNLQRAVTKYCLNDSVVFLLDYDETLSSESDLQTLAKQFYPIGNFAAFLKIKTGQKLNIPQKWQNLKVFDYWRYKKDNTILYNTLANHLRAFTVQIYRLLSSSSLCHIQTGRYFNREIPILTLLQLDGDVDTLDGSWFYRLKMLYKYLDVPTNKVYSNVTINTKSLKVVGIKGYEYRKYRGYTLRSIIVSSSYYDAKIKDVVVFNDGREQKGFQGRKDMPAIIPRKIHQIWLRGTMTQHKKFLIKRLRESHSNYEYYLWGEQNITRQHFPQSYDLIQTLLKFDKKSPYSKISMVADMMRHELIYRHGGFYLDTNYMLMSTDKPLEKLLTYSLVVGGQHTPFHRLYKQSGFFGAPQFSPQMKRIQEHRMLSTRNFFSKKADVVSGPWLLARTIVGDEELNGDFFQPSLDETYPYFSFDDIHSFNKCEAPSNTPESEILFRGKKAYLKNCSKIYDYAIGMDFFSEGGSWIYRRW